MRRMRWAVYLWPGLPQIAGRGSWAALTLAVGAAALLNVALLSSFVWTELMAPAVRTICWATLAGVWCVAAALSAWRSRRLDAWEGSDQAEKAFAEGLDYYLKGNWFEAERRLRRLLRRNGLDLEARLTLATLLRHTRRYDEAARQLSVLAHLEGAGKWEREIRREEELLVQARCDADTRGESPDETGPEPEQPEEMVQAA